MEILFSLGGKEYIIHDTIVNIWFVIIVLSVLSYFVNKTIKQAKVDEVPTGFQNVIETAIEATNNLVRDTMGERNMKFGPYIFTLMAFLAVANLLGLIGLTPPTSDYSVTFSLAIVTFFLTQIFQFRTSRGLGGYLKSFTEPFVLLTPLNVIGELANPVSLSFRLFGNIMSGGIILGLIYQAAGLFAPVLAAPLHAYFDVFSGLLQTFIFIMLTMIFVGGVAE